MEGAQVHVQDVHLEGCRRGGVAASEGIFEERDDVVCEGVVGV